MNSEHTLRRVVTGHDAEGKSIIALDDTPETAPPGGTEDTRALTEIWATTSPTGASAFRVVEMPAGSRREMHRTDSVDYGIVLAGEIYLLLEREETKLCTGDVVIQRGTSHAWHNRSNRVARMAFINLSGHVTDAQKFP